MYRQRGLSLIELMISITLGLILLTGVMQMFLSSRAVFSTQQGMSRIQESGRLAMEFVSRDVRMAGYMGCVSQSGADLSNALKNSDKFPYRMNIGLEGYKAPLPVAADTVLSPAPVAGTDVLVVRSASGDGARVSTINTGTEVLMTGDEVAGGCSDGSDSYGGICASDILIVSDCIKARIFQTTEATPSGAEVSLEHEAAGTPGNALADWTVGGKVDMVFQPGADVLSMNHIVYYIGLGASGQPALFQNINGVSPSLELLEGVEDMRLFYSRADTPATYVPVADLPAGIWAVEENPVVSVRVELLVRSTEDGVLEESQTFVFPSGSAARKAIPADRRMRQIFTSTVGIRSRLP